MPKISIDREKCIGCGACAALCPKSFRMKENKAVAIKAEIAKISCEKEAADSCPVQVISIK